MIKKFLLVLILALGVFQLQEAYAEPNNLHLFSQDCPEGEAVNLEGFCIKLQEPISGVKSIRGETGVELLSNYIWVLYKYTASMIGIICVLVVVISGIQISVGGVSSEAVTQGKSRILQAIASLVLLFLSAALLQAVNPGFFSPQEKLSAQTSVSSTEAPADTK